MEHASTLLSMPFQKDLRKGQNDVVEAAINSNEDGLNAQLPTGYGKTFTACCVYSMLNRSGKVNRLLYIVPTRAQLDQFVIDGPVDLVDAGVTGQLAITDITYTGAISLKQHRNNTSQVFATTVQALTSGRAWETVLILMETGRWMIVIDEYHHYGINAHWGHMVSKLNYTFRLAMSATPYRPKDDSAFGKPDITVSYIDAKKEHAVKPLRLHSYIYRVDVVNSNGDVSSYTTEQIAQEAGSEKPEKIDKMMIDRQMRWSPKYVSPLVDRPIARMQRERIRTGYPLQVLVGAMSCSHAELVCGQLRAMFPELRIDWVGTGLRGRPDKTNAKILGMFCPKKVEGKRRPEDIKLDILVHVGMAGEGLDSVFVSEIVHLNRASINNTNNQENGRAARYIPDVTGYINVDSSSPYSPFIGESIMDVMDDLNAEPKEPEDDDNHTERDEDDDWPDIPDEPKIRIWDMECIRVDEGETRRFGMEMARAAGLSENDVLSIFENEKHPNRERWMRMAENGYRQMRKDEAEIFNSKSITMQWESSVNGLVSALTGQIIRIVSTSGIRIEKSFAGDIKKRINQRKKREVGKIERDIETLKLHWQWLKNLEEEMRGNGVPEWLR